MAQTEDIIPRESLLDDDNKPSGSIGVILDITDLSNYQKSLEKAKEVELSDINQLITMAFTSSEPHCPLYNKYEQHHAVRKKEVGRCSTITSIEYSEIGNISNLMDEVLLLEKVSTGNSEGEK